MVKLTKYILLACIVLTQQACVKDLQDDINDGGWNHERTILDIQFENQMGTALIETVDAFCDKAWKEYRIRCLDLKIQYSL